LLPLLAPLDPSPEYRQRLVPGQGIRQVAEVDEVDDVLRRHLGQQLPER
jgi:hypothetical protein